MAKKIVIGEGMGNRVIPFANSIGAEYYEPPALDESLSYDDMMDKAEESNRDWINEQMDEGHEIIDCGAEPGRENYPEATSRFYKAEQEEIQNRQYENYSKVDLDADKKQDENLNDTTENNLEKDNVTKDELSHGLEDEQLEEEAVEEAPPPEDLEQPEELAEPEEMVAEVPQVADETEAQEVSEDQDWKHDLGEGIADRNQAETPETQAQGEESAQTIPTAEATEPSGAAPSWQSDLGEGIADREAPASSEAASASSESESMSM